MPGEIDITDTRERERNNEPSLYFSTRLDNHRHRSQVWKHLTSHLQRWIPASADVCELGAGRCDFSNQIQAKSVTAMDIDPIVAQSASEHVTSIVGDCTDLGFFANSSFDVVFASNFLEHIDRNSTIEVISQAARILRKNGKLILLQPNYRLNPGRYFDDFTHISIWTDQSLCDFLKCSGWNILASKPRFLPLSMKSRLSIFTGLVPWYLRSPIKPLAGQMLVCATPTPAQ